MKASEEISIFRDMQVALEVRSMAALGKFPKEITVYGLLYYQNGQRQYMISAEAAKLISFLNDAANRKYFPTPMESYSERVVIPEGYEEDVVQRIKLRLARSLQENYPSQVFQALEQLSAQEPNDSMEQKLLAYRAGLESVFCPDKLQAFQTLCTRTYLRKNISLLVYQQLMHWIEKRLTQLEENIPPKSKQEKTFYGLAVLPGHQIGRCVVNANLKCIYEEQCALEEQGLLLTSWHKKAFHVEKQESLQGLKRQMADALADIYDQDLIALMEQVEQAPSVIDQKAWQRLFAQTSVLGEKAKALVKYYGRQWGVDVQQTGGR